MQSDSEFMTQLELVRQGDSEALNRLFAACRSMIRQHARGLLGSRYASRVDSSDLVQETMTQAYQDVQKFRGETRGEWMAWLKSILRAKLTRARRHHSAAKRSAIHEEADMGALIGADSVRPDARLMEHERRSKLTLALEELPDSMSEVIVRRIFLRQQFDEVAEALGKPPGTVRVIWIRAVEKLRELLPSDFVVGEDLTNHLSEPPDSEPT